jgi:hypothetical protein
MRHPFCSEDNIAVVINRTNLIMLTTSNVFSPHVNISIGFSFYFV